MKKIVLFTAAFFTLSCSTYERTKFEYHFGNAKNEWVNNFKTEFFIKCLKKGYENDSIFKLIAKKDFQYLYEPYAYQHNVTDSLAIKVIKNLPKPIYPHCDDCSAKEVEENLKKNYICASCLNYYGSRELDSIAKVKFKKEKIID